MLTLWRRHTQDCPHQHKGRDYLKCRCPIWIDWRMQGQRIRKPLGLRDWQAAQQRARDMEATGIEKVGEAVTIQKATADFEADALNMMQAVTLKQYKILFRQLNAFSQSKGLVFLRQIGVVEAREFRNTWTVSPRTAGKHLERLKRFFNWCMENEWIASNPAKPLKSPKVGDTDVIPFTEEQIAKILKTCEAYEGSNRVRLIILTKFMLASALRIGDAVTISKERIVKSAEGYSVVLRTAKTGVPVSCPLPTDVAKSLLELTNEFPFWTHKSSAEKCAAGWRKIFARIFKAAGIEGHPHQFRHTAAKRLLVAGVPIGYVASILGNSVKICEKHYSKWIVERQHAVDKAVRASWKAENVGHA